MRTIVWTICWATLVVIIILFLGFNNENGLTGRSVINADMNTIEENGLVKDVIDGDTIVVQFSNGADKTIRILGVDFPDLDKNKIKKWEGLGLNQNQIKECYNKGVEDIKNLILGKMVKIELDLLERDVDEYGRILGYVYFDGLDLSEYLVKNGYAVMFDPTEPLCSHCSKLKSMEFKQGCLVE